LVIGNRFPVEYRNKIKIKDRTSESLNLAVDVKLKMATKRL